MKDGYTTLKDIGEASFTEKKSEFIGAAMPVQTEEEALEFIKGLNERKLIKDAKGKDNQDVSQIRDCP